MAYSKTPATTVRISVSESGMSSSPTNINSSQVLYAIDNRTKITKSTGVRVQKGTQSGVLIFDESSMGDGSNAQAYIYAKCLDKNDDALDNVTVTLASTLMGRLYRGQAMFFPVLAEGGNDVTLTGSASDVEVEWCVWYEKADDGYVTSALV